LSGSKAYLATGKFGYETDTLDAVGQTLKDNVSYEHITEDTLRTTIQSTQFVGQNIQQIPPLYSALKKNGKPYYQYARESSDMKKVLEMLNIQPRTITISKIELLSYDKSTGEFIIDVECGGGTYIRSLIRDIAYALNSVATMTQLQRTKQGPFTLKHSSLSTITTSAAAATSSENSQTEEQQLDSKDKSSGINHDVLYEDDWNPRNIYSALERWKESTSSTSFDAATPCTTASTVATTTPKRKRDEIE
jgi:tRNA pseudouridine55 synthase